MENAHSFGFFTGARLTDCCRMTWESVDLAGVFSRLFQTKREARDGANSPELEAHLNKLATSDKPEKFIMPGMASKGPGGRHGLSESFKSVMRKAGIDSQRVERDKASARFPEGRFMRCGTPLQVL